MFWSGEYFSAASTVPLGGLNFCEWVGGISLSASLAYTDQKKLRSLFPFDVRPTIGNISALLKCTYYGVN